MKCTTARDAMTAGARPEAGDAGVALQRHLDECSACRAYAARVAAARRYFGEHHANVQPDGAFVARVRSRLESGPVELMGRAALRLLPACLALLAVMGWFAWHPTAETPTPDAGDVRAAAAQDEVISPTEDLLVWVLEEDDGDTP